MRNHLSKQKMSHAIVALASVSLQLGCGGETNNSTSQQTKESSFISQNTQTPKPHQTNKTLEAIPPGKYCAQRKNRQHSVIVRPAAMVHSETWRDFSINQARLLNALNCYGVKRIFIEMRLSDNGNVNDPSYIPGAMMYHSKLPYTRTFTASTVERGNVIKQETADYDYYIKNKDGKTPINYIDIANFIQTASDNGFEVWGWLPIFNDPVLWKEGNGFCGKRKNCDRNAHILQPQSSDPNEKFVSPAHPKVRQQELNVIGEIANNFEKNGLKGIAIDWYRYTSDTQPQDPYGQTGFVQHLQDNGFDPNNIPKSERDAQFKIFREKILTDYLKDIRNALSSNIKLGAFLLPHSAKKINARWYGSGINLENIAKMNLGLHIMPMVYWNRNMDWMAGYEDWMPYADDIISNMSSWIKGTNNTFSPVFSLATSDQYSLNRQTRVAANHQTEDVVFFFSGNWFAPHNAEKDNDNLSPLEHMCVAVGFATQDCFNWPLSLGWFND